MTMYLSFLVSGAYGKLMGAGGTPLSSYRYSPYPIPVPNLSSASAALANPGGLAGSLQYSVANPVSQTTPAVLSAITSPAVNQSSDQSAAAATAAEQLAVAGAAAAAGTQTAIQPHQLPALSYPYPMGLPAIDWSSMYSLPAGMYTL